MPNVKDDRLQIRVDPDAKRLLEEAAAAAHVSVSAFVLQAAAEQAENVLADRRLIQTSTDAAATLAEALRRPARVNDRLAAALDRPRAFSWLD
ncbi:MAG: DUF1778 domain-containing protein [Acidimicrobiales bacterium]